MDTLGGGKEASGAHDRPSDGACGADHAVLLHPLVAQGTRKDSASGLDLRRQGRGEKKSLAGWFLSQVSMWPRELQVPPTEGPTSALVALFGARFTSTSMSEPSSELMSITSKIPAGPLVAALLPLLPATCCAPVSSALTAAAAGAAPEAGPGAGGRGGGGLWCCRGLERGRNTSRL